MWGPPFLLLTVAAMMVAPAASQKKVVCYYENKSAYRVGDGKLQLEDLNASLCTHAIYAFAKVKEDGSVLADQWADIEQSGYTKFNNLRLKNTELKTLVAVGGWDEGSTVFSSLCANANKRATFVTNLFNFVRQNGFNGLDVAWEYPAQRGGAPEDKANFVLLLRELRAKFAPEDLLLTAAVGAGVWMVATSYDVPQLATQLDYINLMTYDYHGSWEDRTGQNAPLYASSNSLEEEDDNVNASVNFWLQQGAPAAKLVLGVPLYGRSFTLASAANTGLGAPTTGAGAAGQFTQEAGMLGYNEICSMQQQQPGWASVWDEEQKVPYSFKGTFWVGYDNIQSVGIKAKYAKTKGLGGVNVWSVNMDDFRGTCGTGAFPLLSKIKATFG